jgi:hypothetical protein
MKPGTQIAYIPTHANNDINHEDVEFGFITSKSDKDYFCRYWSGRGKTTLRTAANSERTPSEMLVEYVSVSQKVVDEWMKKNANG